MPSGLSKFLYKNGKNRQYPRGGRKRRIGRGVRQLQRVSRDIAMMKERINTEFKSFTSFQNTAPIPTCTTATMGSNGAWILVPMSNIPLGTGMAQREGATVLIKSIQHSCTILNTVVNSVACRVRVIFFLDLRPTQDSNIVFPPNFLLDSTCSDPINAFRELSQRSQLSILTDRVYKLQANGVVGDMAEISYYSRKNYHMQWTDTDTNGFSIRKNGLFCAVLTDNPSAIQPPFRCSVRLRYIDN